MTKVMSTIDAFHLDRPATQARNIADAVTALAKAGRPAQSIETFGKAAHVAR